MPELRTAQGGERGMALPLALLGLVSVSLLVTTALVTSSTELAISDANRTATAALYSAEGGLQAYVAQHVATLDRDAGRGELEFTPAAGGPAVGVTVVHLGSTALAGRTTLRLYSVLAHPAGSAGRTVSAVVTQVVTAAAPLALSVTAAMTVAGDLRVGGAARVTGRSTACDSSGVAAILLSAGSALSLGAPGEAAPERGGTAAEVAASLLGGRSLREIAGALPESDWRYRSRSPAFSRSWLAGALPSGGGVAVVDAQGGRLSLGPGSYTGLLIVLDGSVTLDAETTFDGVILAERAVSLGGNAAVAGAIAALAPPRAAGGAGEESTVTGTASVVYDHCRVDEALRAYAAAVPQTRTPLVPRTVSWLEVAR